MLKKTSGRIINEEDAEARAAAKERRRAQDAANKAANDAFNGLTPAKDAAAA